VDANAAALAVGIVGKGDGALIMGTSSVLIMGMDSWAECGNLAEIYHVSTQKTVVYGPMSATGASLKWIRDQFTQKSGPDGDEDLYRQLTDEAAGIPPGADGLIFLPYMMGERAPLWDPYAQGTLFGLSLATTRGHMVRAIMEGAAFAINDNYQEAQRLGLHLNRLMAVGGGNNEFWLKIIGSVLNVPISLPVRSNGTVWGAAILAGAGTGLYPDLEKTARECLSLRKTIEPDPRWHAHYQKVFAIYKDLYAQLKSNMHRLAATVF
jgi:xylulokinase